MKKIFFVLVLLAILVFAVTPVFAQGATPASPSDTSGLALPVALVLLLQAGVTFLVTDGVKEISKKWGGADLSKLVTVIVAAVVGALVFFANSLLGAVPAQYAPVVQAGFGFVALMLAAFGWNKQFSPPAS